VAVYRIILPLSQYFAEATAKGPRIQSSWAWQHTTAESFYFTCEESRVRAERTEVKFKQIPVDIFQNVEEPGLDTTGVHHPQNV
jgi:hypothetical protein